MKVCYVLSTSEKSGGANRSFLDLVSNLDREKVQPSVLLRIHGDIEDELNQRNIPYTVIPFINAVKTGNKLKDLAKKTRLNPNKATLTDYFEKNSFDIIHNNSLPTLAPMEAAQQLHIPYVCHIREDLYRMSPFLDHDRHVKAMKNASVNIAISDFIASAYKNDLGDSKVRIMPDGIDVSMYRNINKTVFENEQVTASIYGNLIPLKRQLDAVKAIELLHKEENLNIVLNVVGNLKTDYAQKVISYVNDHNLDYVHIHEAISDQTELLQRRIKDDIELMCSSAEGLGRVTIESMLCGCLTIGAKAGATPEIIDNGKNGYLYACGDCEDLSSVILSAVHDKKRSGLVAEQGRKYALSTYNIKDYADQMVSIYEGILND